MTSSSKKKKKKRADFQKVKLKVGRKIAKALNETKTSFQSKHIIIREQHFKATSSDASVAKLNLEEFYHGIRNQNSSVRKDALVNFRKCIGDNIDVINLNLRNVLQHLSKLVEDRTGDVRKLAILSLKTVLNAVARENIRPLFSIIAAYLNCAMTHIEPAIQRDSLEFLDFLLELFPDMLVASHEQLLRNFLQLISHRNENSSKSGFGARVLTVNPNKMMTEEAWRTNVLKRLQRFLKSLVKSAGDSKKQQARSPLELVWNETTQLYASFGAIPQEAAMSFLRNGCIVGSSLLESPVLEEFGLAMMALIFDTWKESSASEEIGKGSNACLSVEALEYLHCLMDIICSILQCFSLTEGSAHNSDKTAIPAPFREKYGATFGALFLRGFPYKLKVNCAQQRNSKSTGLNPQTMCVDLNLLVARTYIQLENGRTTNNVTNIDEYLDASKRKFEKQNDSARLQNINELQQLLSKKEVLRSEY